MRFALEPAATAPTSTALAAPSLALARAAQTRHVVAVPDGRRAPADEIKRADNVSRATATRLVSEATGFFNQGVLATGASAQESLVADAIMARARERASRAHHASKDKRLGTALTKFELLCAVLPSLREFTGLSYEGDLDTSERNELLLIAVAEFVRERPKATAAGGVILGATVAGQVSAVKVCVEDHIGRKIIAPTGGLKLKQLLKQMRFEDGPGGERKYLAPLRAAHFAQLTLAGSTFDYSSSGWPTARWALLLIMHQCLMRGGEPGRLPGQPFRPALGLCWSHFVWINPTSLQYATSRDKVTGQLHWLLTILVRSIKDSLGKLKRVPIPVASKHPMQHPLGDPTCAYSAVRRLWCEREHLVPVAQRASTPFFLGPRGVDAVHTDEARDAIRAGASALNLDPGVFGGSAPRRGGATDLRDALGHAPAKQIVVDRGRWCPTGDIDDIYARASLEEHTSASVGLAHAGQGVSLEQANPGWVQPASWRAT